MKISVIIPVYNTEKYLHQCFDSIINQTFSDIEILAVDDGSTDGSADILKEYAEKYPNKFKPLFKENGGQATARNMAIDVATGEYLGFVDSDDWIDPEMYEEMYNKAKEEDADIVICDTTDHYPDKDVYHHASTFTSKFRVTPHVGNKIFRREFVADRRFPKGLWYEDLEFTAKNLMLTEKVSVIHKGFYHSFCREVSTMFNNNSKKNMDMLTILQNLTDFVEENSMQDKYSTELEFYYIDHVLITTINRLQCQKNPEKKQVMKAMINEVKTKYPKFYKDSVFKEMPAKRRLVALLNYFGLAWVSQVIFAAKSKIAR